MNNTTTNTITFPPSKAFRRGLNNLRVADYPAVTAGILDILGVSTRPAMFYYADGKGNLDIDKARQIDALFRSYGVTEIWGEE